MWRGGVRGWFLRELGLGWPGMNRNSYHYDLFRPRDLIEVMDRAGYRGHGRGEFVKATVTDYTSRFQANEAWRVEFVYNETGEKGVVTLDNHFEEVRLPGDLGASAGRPLPSVRVGTDCFSICCIGATTGCTVPAARSTQPKDEYQEVLLPTLRRRHRRR